MCWNLKAENQLKKISTSYNHALITTWCELILGLHIFMGYSFVYDFWISRIWWETQRRFPLDTNLTKWLSKCEDSLLEGKEKIQLYGVMMMRCIIKKHKMKQEMEKMTEWKREDEEIRNDYGVRNHATCKGRRLQDEWWRASTWNAQTLKIRPKDNRRLSSLNTLTEFLFYSKYNVWNTWGKTLYL